ncbi:hypothetical protein D9M72_578140 [compost metagenome]
MKQETHSKVIDARIVPDDSEVLGTAVAKGEDQIFWDAAKPESSGCDGNAVAY